MEVKMKDKLIKTNRRATYYRSKKFALTLLTLFGLFLAAFIPVKVLEENPHLLQAHDTTSETQEDNDLLDLADSTL
jgi:hypothetical protein